MDSMKRIYAYWEGPKNWYYDLCWQTVRYWNPGATLIGPKEVEEVIGPIPKELQDVYIIHKVDWIRKKWIHAVGGLWLDCDVICWSDLSPLVAAGEAFDFIGYKEWHETGWMDNFFAGRKGSVILKDAADYALNQVQRTKPNIPWLSTNADTMNNVLTKHKFGFYMQIPTHLVSPVSCTQKSWFVSQIEDDINGYKSFGIITSYHCIGELLKTFSNAEQLMRSNTNLKACFQRAFTKKDGLIEVFSKYNNRTDKLTEHSYLPFYQQKFTEMKDSVSTVVEVGVDRGGSLAAWKEWFGADVRVVGIDIADISVPEKDVEIIKADSTIPGEWIEKIGNCDIIIDDGNHEGKDQLATWRNLWPMLRPGGLYVIEDVFDDNVITQLKTELPEIHVEDFRHFRDRADDVLIWAKKQ